MTANNPDNVGGLPPLPESLNSVYIIHREGGVSVENPFSDYYSVDQMRAYGELCRAAPAGGDAPTVLDALYYLRAAICETEAPECYWDITEAVGGWIADANLGKSTPKRDSAPVGSGEVEAIADEIDACAARYVTAADMQDWSRRLRALLRKLQQGAE